MNDDLKRWNEEAKEWSEKTLTKRPIVQYLVKPEYKKLFENLSGKKILDAGCGEGVMAEYLTNLGAHVIGIDGSPKMIEYARQRRPSIEFKVQDLLGKIDFHDSSFDGILSSFVLMSLSEMDTFLSESYRILKANGIMVIGVFHPAFNNPTMKLYRPWWAKILNKPVKGLAFDYFLKTARRKDDNGTKSWPFYHRTIEQYVDLFRKHNFQIDKITEPHEMPAEAVERYRMFYATRLPRFIFFKLIKASR
jgi:ubiquinone/menaquinone biosynthesis C-methylase UbiE